MPSIANQVVETIISQSIFPISSKGTPSLVVTKWINRVLNLVVNKSRQMVTSCFEVLVLRYSGFAVEELRSLDDHTSSLFLSLAQLVKKNRHHDVTLAAVLRLVGTCVRFSSHSSMKTRAGKLENVCIPLLDHSSQAVRSFAACCIASLCYSVGTAESWYRAISRSINSMHTILD